MRKRLLFIVQKFRQGWGGAPESVRLMANQLLQDGIDADVYDDGTIVLDVGQLSLLPEPGGHRTYFNLATVRNYDAIIQTGPWQRPASSIKALLALRKPGQKIFYLPRGGLGYAEFRRVRDLKKFPYLVFIERSFIRSANWIVLSSTAEQRNTIRIARRPPNECVIPDFVNGNVPIPPPLPRTSIVNFAFLAEISPRKGLLPLIEAFIAWARLAKLEDGVRLIVGGAPRPGSEKYLAKVKELCAKSPEIAIELRGAIPHVARSSFYGETDIMVVSSSFESFGLTVIEALVQGCAVVSTPNIGALDALPERLPIVVAEGNDADFILSALQQAYDRFSRRTEADRLECRLAAQAAVDLINLTAREKWKTLFLSTPPVDIEDI